MTTRPRPSATPTGRQRARRGSAEDHEDLRQEIIASAFVIHEREGLAALSMRALAADLGLSPMALYRYFSSKGELLRAMLKVVLAAVSHEVVTAKATRATPRARLRASIDRVMRYWETHPAHFRLVFMTPETMADESEALMNRTPEYQQAIDLSQSLIDDLVAEVGGNRQRAPVARDLRDSLMVGYLYARIVNSRYPWSDFDALRESAIDTIALGVENCVRLKK